VAVSTTVVLVRLAWMFPGSRIALWLARLHYPSLPAPPWRDVFVAGWAGIRGAVTLAAALSLPLMAGANPFPERDLLVFLATSVIVFTLVVNGLSLPFLIRWLSVRDDGLVEREERAARIAANHAAIRELRSRMDHQEDAQDHEFTLGLIREHERHVRKVTEWSSDGAERTATIQVESEREIRLHSISAQRAELRQLHAQGKINENVLLTLQRELDFQEASLRVRELSGVE